MTGMGEKEAHMTGMGEKEAHMTGMGEKEAHMTGRGVSGGRCDMRSTPRYLGADVT